MGKYLYIFTITVSLHMSGHSSRCDFASYESFPSTMLAHDMLDEHHWTVMSFGIRKVYVPKYHNVISVTFCHNIRLAPLH
jgi:hypothetical protein